MLSALADPSLRLPLTYVTVAQLLDVLTTLAGFARGLDELNPVTVGLVARLGLFGLLVQKAMIVTAVLLAAAILPRRTGALVCWVFTLVMTAVVASNVAVVVAARP